MSDDGSQSTNLPLTENLPPHVSGAVFMPGVDAAVPAHYGNPVAEQRQLATRGVVDVSHRGVITISGPERLTWLHSLTTQHITELPVGGSTESLLLSPQGHVEHHLRLRHAEGTLWLTCEPGRSATIVTWLKRMQFMAQVEVSDVTDQWAACLVVGDTDTLADNGQLPAAITDALAAPACWTSAWPAVCDGGFAYGPETSEHPGSELGTIREVLIPRTELIDALTNSSEALCGHWAWEALRVAAWLPRDGFDTDHRTIPHEVDWLRSAVHLEKGCYRGQETVARVKNLGQPPRRIVFLHLDGSGHVLPETGAEITADGRKVGKILTTAQHHELGPIALAVVKRSAAPDADFLIGDIAAAQTPIVGQSEVATRPKLARLRH